MRSTLRFSSVMILGVLAAFSFGFPKRSMAGPNVSAAVKPPGFEEYPAPRLYRGKHRAPILSGEARMFRTRIREGAREKVNFAGKYVFTYWGCGTECIMAAAVDVSNGRVFMLPWTLCCWNAEEDPFEIRIDSRLILLRGERNEDENLGTWYYRIDDARGWVLVREVPKPPLGQG